MKRGRRISQSQQSSQNNIYTQTSSQPNVDDEYLTQSPPSQPVESISNEVRENLISSVVRYILFQDTKRHPIRMIDLKKTVFSSYKGSKMIMPIFEEARKRLETIFRFKLVEVETVDKHGVAKASPGVYIVENALKEEYKQLVEDNVSKHDKEYFSMLMIVLSLILINRVPIEKDELIKLLSYSGISSDSTIKFEDWIDSFLKSFVNQLYIEKITSADHQKVSYTIGQRSRTEIGREKILEHVAKIHGEEVDKIQLRELLLETTSRKEKEATAAASGEENTRRRKRQKTS